MKIMSVQSLQQAMTVTEAMQATMVHNATRRYDGEKLAFYQRQNMLKHLYTNKEVDGKDKARSTKLLSK